MGFPSVVSQVTDPNKAASTSHVLTMPSNLVVGDLLVLFVFSGNTTSAGHNVSGWTLIAFSVSGSGATIASSWAKIIVGGDGATVTMNDATAQVLAATTLHVTGWAGITGNASNPGTGVSAPNCLTHTTTFARDNLWFACCTGGNNTTLTVPTNYTNLTTIAQNGSTNTLATCYREAATITEDPGAFGGALNNPIVMTTAIFPGISSTNTQRTRRRRQNLILAR